MAVRPLDSRPETTGNPELLRREIDSGRTGDKIAWPDPAAAPLGTDDEAAGRPLTQRDVEQALKQETRRVWHPHQRQSGLGFAWIVVLFAVLLGLVFLAPLLGR